MARSRIFIAIELPEDVRRGLTLLQREFAQESLEVKWVEPNNFHITLLFLGEVDDRDLAEVCRCVARVATKQASFMVQLGGLGAFPSARRPRTLWAGLNQGLEILVHMHSQILESLEQRIPFRQEERAYTPHVTLGRVAGHDAEAEIARLIPKLRSWHTHKFRAEQIVVFESKLRHAGPEYTAIARVELAGS